LKPAPARQLAALEYPPSQPQVSAFLAVSRLRFRLQT
jgi:hypothetical protein